MASFLTSTGLRLLVAALFTGVGACAQTAAPAKSGPPAPVKLVEPPTPLLPDHLGTLPVANLTRQDAANLASIRFDRAGCGVDVDTPPMVEWHGPCAQVFKEDGLTRLAGGSFGKTQVSAFEFGDATGAFSAYTYLRTLMPAGRLVGKEARLGKGTSETLTDAEGSLVWAGTTVLKVQGRLAADDMTALIAGLPKANGRTGLAPLLPKLLPGEKVEPGTLRYAIGPAGYQAMGGVLPAGMLGWDKSLETATAQYSGKGGKSGTLTLLLYPTPQIAGDRGRAVEKEVNDEGGAAKFGVVKMRRLGPLVGMTSGELAPEQAQALMDGLHLNEEVTYDKPMPLEFHAEIKKTASLLQNIAVLSGVLILAAVLLGLFLGGARAGWRVMHGKSAASEPEFLTISLRDEPKALFVPKEDAPK